MDTLKISLWLNISLILLLIVGSIYIVILIKGKTVDDSNIDKIIDLFKIVLVTTVSAIIANIVGDYFKERDYDKNEMVTFNQYIPYVIDTTGTIDKKINFCTFFASVTPKGELREGWKNYTSYLKEEKNKLQKITNISKAKTESLTKKDAPPTNEELANLESEEAQKQKILTNINAVENTSYLVILGTGVNIKATEPEIQWAKDHINPNAIIYKKRNWYRIVIPVNTSYKDAKEIAKKIRSIDPKRGAYVVSLKTWCNSTTFSKEENCIICN